MLKWSITNGINNSAGDCKKMWKTLKELLPNKKGHVTTLPKTPKGEIDLANDFNNHFTNLGATLASRKNDVEIRSTSINKNVEFDTKFSFSEITVDQVKGELNDISQNKASGLDNICTKLLKYASIEIAPVLCSICNLCLKQGKDDLKTARVTPIFKSGDKDDFSNYRPIYILPICSKTLEKKCSETTLQICH